MAPLHIYTPRLHSHLMLLALYFVKSLADKEFIQCQMPPLR